MMKSDASAMMRQVMPTVPRDGSFHVSPVSRGMWGMNAGLAGTSLIGNHPSSYIS